MPDQPPSASPNNNAALPEANPPEVKPTKITKEVPKMPEPEAANTLLNLSDFCRLKSASLGRRVEILSGFFNSQKANASARLSEAEWDTRFAAFRKAPVGTKF